MRGKKRVECRGFPRGAHHRGQTAAVDEPPVLDLASGQPDPPAGMSWLSDPAGTTYPPPNLAAR